MCDAANFHFLFVINIFYSGDVESNPGPVLHIQDNCLTLPRRTSLFGRSFVPSVIQQWNTLSPV